MKELVSRGADFEVEDGKGRRPIHLAANNGHADVVLQLLSDGCDYGATDKRGWSAMHFAALRGHVEIVRSLIGAGASVRAAAERWSYVDLNGPREHDGDGKWAGQPLHLAARAANVPIVAMILDAGADVNACSTDLPGDKGYFRRDYGPTPLHIALDYPPYPGRHEYPLGPERLDVASMLVERRADVSMKRVADHISLKLVMRFENHQELWDKLRAAL